MNVYSAFLMAYHNRSLVRLPVFYLHYVYGIPFRELNDHIYDEFCRTSTVMAPVFDRVRKVYRDFVEIPGSNDAMELDEVPEAPIVVNPSRWIFAQTMFRKADFYRELTEFLVCRYPNAINLRSAMKFQENVAIDPDFDWRQGRSFSTEFDWMGFMREAALGSGNGRHPEPEPFYSPRNVVIADHEGRRSHLVCFGEGTSAERHVRWVVQIAASLHTSAFGVFSEVTVA